MNPQNENQYILTFTPDEDLMANQTYTVSIDPNLHDDNNNLVLPFNFQFTTKMNMDNRNNPHGNYVVTSSNGEPIEDNTFKCAFCHSTHNGTNPPLGIFLDPFGLFPL